MSLETRPETIEEKARAVLFGWPSLVEDRPEPVTGDAWVQDGYNGRCEPVTGLAFQTFAGRSFKEPGARPAEGSIQPTPEEAMRVHVEALSAWLKSELPKFTRPVVCVRMWPELIQMTGPHWPGSPWMARTRLLVTEGGRDVLKVPLGEQVGKWLDEVPLAVIRGVVMADQPVVGVIA